MRLTNEGERVEAADEEWFRRLLEEWRTQAHVRDLGMSLDDAWTPERAEVVVRLLRQLDLTGVQADVRQAIVELIDGTLEPDPPKGYWYVGVEPGRRLVMPDRS